MGLGEILLLLIIAICGTSNTPGRLYCQGCGIKLNAAVVKPAGQNAAPRKQQVETALKLSEFCGQCGASVPSGTIYCTQCGAKTR